MKTTSADGTTIAYDVVGSGPPVVIVDGAYVSRAIDTFPVDLPGVLAPRFSVAPYERRGRGESGDTAPYAVAYDARIMDGKMAGRPLPFERWARVTTPILVLVGEQSDRFLQTGTRAFADGMPTATHRSFDTGAAESHAVTPEALAHVLEEFLA